MSLTHATKRRNPSDFSEESRTTELKDDNIIS